MRNDGCRFIIWLIALTLAAPTQEGFQSLKTDLNLFISDCWGGEIREASIELKPQIGASILFRYPARSLVEIIPAQYTMIVRSQGFLTWKRLVGVWGKETLIASCLTLAPIEAGLGSFSSLTGNTAKKLIQGRKHWVRLVGIYSDFNSIMFLDKSGSFRFTKLTPGRYLVMLFSDARLTSSREINLRIFDNTVKLD